jgi:hypothetical protein
VLLVSEAAVLLVSEAALLLVSEAALLLVSEAALLLVSYIDKTQKFFNSVDLPLLERFAQSLFA